MSENNPSLRIYSLLARVPFLRGYRSKIMVVAFLGTHVPLLSLLLWFLISQNVPLSKMLPIIGVALVATLLGTIVTLLVINGLLRPILLSSRTLRDFLQDRKKVRLPVSYNDEAGTLMSDTSVTLNRLFDLLDQMENYDPLTGLPNRRLFLQEVRHYLSEENDEEMQSALMIVSLERIPEVQVSFGQKQADELINSAGLELLKVLGDRAIIARIGSQEFGLFIQGFGSRREDTSLGDDIQSLVESSMLPSDANRGMPSKVLVSVAFSPGDAMEATDLLEKSYAALHTARENALFSGTSFFSIAMRERIQNRIVLEDRIRTALQNNEFQLYLQPKLDVRTNSVLSAEALIRWPDGHGGFISPGEFIPVAEDSGLILSVGQWVVQEAIRLQKAWNSQSNQVVTVSVNLSPKQFQSSMDWFFSSFSEHNMAPQSIEVEVTESVFLKPSDQLSSIMERFREHGIPIALDDFGTGYSSLAYLRHFRVDRLKIDRSFIQGLPEDRSSSAIVRSVLDMARSLDIETTIEGVETDEQMKFLTGENTGEIQGYFFARPMPEEDFFNFLNNQALALEPGQR